MYPCCPLGSKKGKDNIVELVLKYFVRITHNRIGPQI